MKINIYYGGRGVSEDPTIYVINRMMAVFKELRVEVEKYNIFEEKNAIATMPATLKEADGVILATTVEWFGIGGYMQQFLDMCWLYADKEQLAGKYMLPVVMATTYGERDAELSLVKAWETLGGLPITGLVAYVENLDEFESNEDYRKIIDKKTETFYRSINQKSQGLPTSNIAVKANIMKTKTMELTPQESEQLGKFISDETYVKKQKQDIEELSELFKKKLSDRTKPEPVEEDPVEKKSREISEEAINTAREIRIDAGADAMVGNFIKNYHPISEFYASYAIVLSDKSSILHVEAAPDHVKCFYAATEEADVVLRTDSRVMNSIIAGKTTFQKSFMAGEISAKGNFKTLRMLDELFRFKQ